MAPDGGGRILVVDDVEANRDLLSRRLRKQGHEVEIAVDGRDALERVRAEPFDLVLLDIMMPNVNGYEVLEQMKGDPALRHVPVVMISAIEEVESVVRCIEMGAEDHLSKPFNPTLLRARIESSLARKRLRDREQLYARSLEREMEIARAIQRSFLPGALPGAPGWDVAVRFHPARQVAGDFYDAYALPGGRLALVVADVCGKGVGAAVFMAAFRSVMRALTERWYSDANGARDDGERLAVVIASVNDYIATTHAEANMFATMFFAVLDPATGALAYVNAGHDAPVVARADGARERLAPTGPAVGLLPELPFARGEVALGAGDLLLAFTDGVTDARSPDGAAYEEERLLAHLGAPPGEPERLLETVQRDVLAHIAAAEQFDDITLLAVRRGAGATPTTPAGAA